MSQAPFRQIKAFFRLFDGDGIAFEEVGEDD